MKKVITQSEYDTLPPKKCKRYIKADNGMIKSKSGKRYSFDYLSLCYAKKIFKKLSKDID